TSGISIEGSASSNSVIGNYIGTDVTGAADLGNGFNGVNIEGANNNIIGGTSTSARNIISGNDSPNVNIWSSASGNSIQGNYIGTNFSGNAGMGNSWAGIGIWGGAQSNTVGGTAANARNIISGNLQDAVAVRDANTSSNAISGNYIGTDVTGSFAIANGW